MVIWYSECVSCLDFSKVFHTFVLSIFLNRLYIYGIRGVDHERVSSYLHLPFINQYWGHYYFVLR